MNLLTRERKIIPIDMLCYASAVDPISIRYGDTYTLSPNPHEGGKV